MDFWLTTALLADMPISPASRELILQDWTAANLAVLRSALIAAYATAASACDPEANPIFNTPNRPLVAGGVRWLAVDAYLLRAFEAGRFTGIEAKWVPLGGNKKEFPCHLVLEGANTLVTAMHLQEAEDMPRDSRYRRNARIANEACPLLTGFADPYAQDESGAKVNLLLVHGDKEPDFAELRAYYCLEDRSQVECIVPNFMTNLQPLASPDVEPVAEPMVALLEHPRTAGRSAGA